MNYKLLYFAFISDQFGGVEQKIVAQFDALHKLKKETFLYLISKSDPGDTLASEIQKRPNIEIFVNSEGKRRNPWIRRKEKFDIISSILAKYNPKKTLVYLRYPEAEIIFSKFLGKNKEYIFVTEHQDIENRLKIGIFRIKIIIDIFDLLFGKSIRKRITGFVGVTSQITDYERTYFCDQSHFFTTIGNGIDTFNYPQRCPKNNLPTNEIRILFIGAGFPHHGLSRLIKSISNYYKRGNNVLQIYLKIAGDSKAMNRNRDLVKRLKLSSKIFFLGNLESNELDELFNWAQIGCGSLANHKRGLNLTSELKAREYCARGLPFFLSISDDDFNSDFPYILKVPKSNDKFNLDPIISFTNKLATDANHPLKMRQYAIEHLDWSTKMKKLIIFFDKIMYT